MTFKILPVFGRGKEKETVEFYLAFAKLMRKINELFFDTTKAWIDGDFNKVEKMVPEISDLESKSDDIVRTITKHLYTGAFLPGTRGHMHRLSIALDDVIDNMQDTSGMYIFMKKRKFSEDVKNEFWKMVRETENAVTLMAGIVEKLFTGEEILNDMKKAKELEHSCDIIKKKIFKLALFDKRLDPVTSRLICSTASSMEGITDAVEECCVQVTIVKMIRQA